MSIIPPQKDLNTSQFAVEIAASFDAMHPLRRNDVLGYREGVLSYRNGGDGKDGRWVRCQSWYE
jgi:hypothetical protein